MVNKVILIGNIGNDPEVRTVNDSKVANFSLATTERWKSKNGERKEKTSWHRVTMWRGLAEVAEKYLKKGDKVYIEGKLDYREYEQDGVTKYATDIIADNMQMLGGGAGTKSAPAPASTSVPASDDDFPF